MIFGALLDTFWGSVTPDNVQLSDLVPAVSTDETRERVSDHINGLESTPFHKSPASVSSLHPYSTVQGLLLVMTLPHPAHPTTGIIHVAICARSCL